MKTNKRYVVKPDKIHTLEDIRLEKMRLQLEIMKTEESIHSGYRNIIQALSFKNIASTVVNEVFVTSSALTKAFSFGKALLAKRKKRKQEKLKEEAANPGS